MSNIWQDMPTLLKIQPFSYSMLKGRQTKTIATMEETEVSMSSESDELV